MRSPERHDADETRTDLDDDVPIDQVIEHRIHVDAPASARFDEITFEGAP